LDPDAWCESVEIRTEGIAQAMMVLVDRSVWMTGLTPAGGTRWDMTRDLVETFWKNSGPFNVEMGLDYFPAESVLPAAADSGAPSGCASDPGEPAVGIARAFANGEQVRESLAAQAPSGERALGEVFFGAVDALGAERLSFVLRSIVIVSTGPPEACIPADIEQMIAVTASNGIRLYWVGLGGEAPSDAATEDLAGLTFTNETDVSGAVSDFESWFGLTPICEWEIGPPPSFPHVDANQVRVVVEPAGGRSQTVPGVPSAELCSPRYGPRSLAQRDGDRLSGMGGGPFEIGRLDPRANCTAGV
jgi:hypothetical protein